MRLWSLHPRYLDRQALTACWREALLAQSVIDDPDRGYSRHPQLERFRATARPLAAVGAYLAGIADDAESRGYRFNRDKIRSGAGAAEIPVGAIPVGDGQIAYEWTHLLAKLARRSPEVWDRWRTVADPQPHPLFAVVPGPIASWERPSKV